MVRSIGRVEHIRGTKMLIVRIDAANLPKLYCTVIDRKWNPVGKLVEIFGNISAPYAAVICTGSDFTTLVGEKVFVK
ncbi:MAG: Gar1/Naf1 family protein [Methanomicrobiales archaeon]|jgi:RNA-binding protein|nr:Gar1/Naf1 family protein [Methanomicrobiales archaeon]